MVIKTQEIKDPLAHLTVKDNARTKNSVCTSTFKAVMTKFWYCEFLQKNDEQTYEDSTWRYKQLCTLPIIQYNRNSLIQTCLIRAAYQQPWHPINMAPINPQLLPCCRNIAVAICKHSMALNPESAWRQRMPSWHPSQRIILLRSLFLSICHCGGSFILAAELQTQWQCTYMSGSSAVIRVTRCSDDSMWSDSL